jgi:hypothetical protein
MPRVRRPGCRRRSAVRSLLLEKASPPGDTGGMSLPCEPFLTLALAPWPLFPVPAMALAPGRSLPEYPPAGKFREGAGKFPEGDGKFREGDGKCPEGAGKAPGRP